MASSLETTRGSLTRIRRARTSITLQMILVVLIILPAIIEQMDVILSIDTYIVHLAGAMNIPAWIMLPYTPDWRWFLDRSDTPWYPWF